MKEILYGIDDLKTVGTLINLGATYAKAGRYEDALSTFERSLRIVQTNGAVANDPIGAIHMSLGSVYSEMGRYKESISQYESAISIRVTSQCIDFTKLLLRLMWFLSGRPSQSRTF